jgi:hypothetical protein
MNKPIILSTKDRVKTYMPPYHKKLRREWHKLKKSGEDYNQNDYNFYWKRYNDIIKQDEFEQLKSKAIAMQNDDAYFKNNTKRKCLKCHQIVVAGSNICKQKPRVQNFYKGHDSTETAYYVGDQAAAEFTYMFNDLFMLCLAKYPKGDTMRYHNGLVGYNSDRE